MSTKRSHISHLVADSDLELEVGRLLDSSRFVQAWVKNDHLDFHMHYFWRGGVRRYVPDFLVRLTNETMLVLETKGEERETHSLKVSAAQRWLLGVNGLKRYGVWCYEVVHSVEELQDLLSERCCGWLSGERRGCSVEEAYDLLVAEEEE